MADRNETAGCPVCGGEVTENFEATYACVLTDEQIERQVDAVKRIAPCYHGCDPYKVALYTLESHSQACLASKAMRARRLLGYPEPTDE